MLAHNDGVIISGQCNFELQQRKDGTNGCRTSTEHRLSYHLGKGGLATDFNRCVKLYEQSASQGIVGAQVNLSNIYQLGSRDSEPMTIPVDQKKKYRKKKEKKKIKKIKK